jgi:large subunit ribosomal protein L29e
MPKRQRYMSRKGVDPKFLRNQKYCVKGIRAKIVAEGGKKA